MSPLAKALARLQRKQSMPVQDVLAMNRDTLAGDQVVMALVSHGYAVRKGDTLEITDTGRRAT